MKKGIPSLIPCSFQKSQGSNKVVVQLTNLTFSENDFFQIECEDFFIKEQGLSNNRGYLLVERMPDSNIVKLPSATYPEGSQFIDVQNSYMIRPFKPEPEETKLPPTGNGPSWMFKEKT